MDLAPVSILVIWDEGDIPIHQLPEIVLFFCRLATSVKWKCQTLISKALKRTQDE